MDDLDNKSLYRRSSTAPVLVSDKKTNTRLQSFIEKNLSQDDNKFLQALESRQPLRITIPKKALHEWFSPMSKNYMRDIMNACENLMNRRIKAIKGNAFDIINVFTRCTLDEYGELHIEISPEGVAAYNYIEDKKYLLYDSVAINKFTHSPTSYFYDRAIRALGSKEWTFEATVEDLKSQFVSVTLHEKKTKNGIQIVERQNATQSQLRNKYIEPAIEDLKKLFEDKFIDFFIEIGEVRTGPSSGRGRKKISSYVFNIIQILPQIEEEKGIMLQDITILLTQYIKDKTHVFRLMQPWNHPDMDISMISLLKKNLSYFENKNKKGKIDNPVGYLITIMNPKNIYKKIEDIIVSDSNAANAKWNIIKDSYKKSVKGSESSMIENLVVGYYSEERNTIGLRMILSTQVYLEYIYNDNFKNILYPLLKSQFGQDLIINFIYESQGETREHTVLS